MPCSMCWSYPMPLHTYDNFLSYFPSTWALSQSEKEILSVAFIFATKVKFQKPFSKGSYVNSNKTLEMRKNKQNNEKKNWRREKKKLVMSTRRPWKQNDYTSNTIKWHNNLRSHEVRSELNNSCTFVFTSFFFMCSLRATFFHSYRYWDMPFIYCCYWFFLLNFFFFVLASVSYSFEQSCDMFFRILFMTHVLMSVFLVFFDGYIHKLWIFYECKITFFHS